MSITIFLTLCIENGKVSVKSSTMSLKECGVADNPTVHTLVELLMKETESARSLCSIKTTVNRTTAVNAFSRFLREKTACGDGITDETVTADLIKAFEQWHAEKNYSRNYAACNMRNLRALVNRCLGQSKGKELFAAVRTSNTPTAKRAVDKDTLLRLNALKLPHGSMEALARDIAIFQFRAMGMPLIDLAFARKSQLKDGHIVYRRHKTRCQTCVLVTDEIRKILERVSPKDSPYLFPILTTEKPEEADRQYRRFLQRYNRTLGRLSEKAGVNVRLTSYCLRHTWASLAHEEGENMNYISQALAHTNTETTRAYLLGISSEKIDAVSRRVQAFLDSPGSVPKNRIKDGKSALFC